MKRWFLTAIVPLCYHIDVFLAFFLFENNVKKINISSFKSTNWLVAADIRLGEFQCVVDEAARIAHLWRNVAPNWLRDEVVPGKVHQGVLPLYCRSSVVAAKLRQLSVQLAAGFARAGLPVTLVVKVDAGRMPATRPAVAPRVLPGQALKSLDVLCTDLPDGDLKWALQRLLSHQRGAPLGDSEP